MVEARYYRQENDYLVCELCPRYCKIGAGQEGDCWNRKNIDGKLFAVNYGEVVIANYEPIEKKPFFHYYPGATVLSIAPNGCNMKCQFCQNHKISLEKKPTKSVSLDALLDFSGKNHSIGVAYTYTEPFIWFEFIHDAVRKLKGIGQKNLLVSNGYVCEDPLNDVLPYVDAINISLKGMKQETYDRFVEGKLETVLKTIEFAAKTSHVELTYLLIPEVNDSDDEIAEFSKFVVNISNEIPVHFKRYFPHNGFDKPVTPNETLVKAYKIGRSKGLSYIYLQDTDIDGVTDTFCPSCKRLIIKRRDYNANKGGLRGIYCKFCDHKINIKF